jgi:Tfp pilus assembly protein PilZ
MPSDLRWARPAAVAVESPPTTRRPLRLCFPNVETFVSSYWSKAGDAGVFIPRRIDFGLGELVHLELAFPSPEVVFQLRGRVRWRRTVGAPSLPAGTGIAFVQEDPRAIAVLLDYVRGHRRRSLAQRRRRVPVALGVRCVANGEVREAKTENLNIGGIFIRDHAPPDVGTLVSLSLQGVAPGRQIDVDGKVVWRRARGATPGFGVRFLVRSSSTADALDLLVDEVKERLAGG